MEQTGAYRALLVGVCEYEPERELSPLPAVERDLESLRQVLADPEGGAYDEVIVLGDTDRASPSCPTRASILHAMTELISRTDEGDTILFYFAGHGVRRRDRSFLIAADSRRSVIQETAVPLDHLRAALASSCAAAKVALIDACHSDVTRGEQSGGAEAFWDEDLAKRGSGIALLGSCAHDQVAWETAQGGVFTRHIVAGLEGAADVNEDGVVTVGELFSYVSANVAEWAEENSVWQTPTIDQQAVGDIVVGRVIGGEPSPKAQGGFAGAVAAASVDLGTLAKEMEREEALRSYAARVAGGLLENWSPSEQFIHWQHQERRIGLPEGFVGVSWEPPRPDDPWETESETARVMVHVKADSRDPFEALQAIVKAASGVQPKASLDVVAIRYRGEIDLDCFCRNVRATGLQITDFDPSQKRLLTAKGRELDPDWPVQLALFRTGDEAWQVDVRGIMTGTRTRASFPIRPLADKVLAFLEASSVDAKKSEREE